MSKLIKRIALDGLGIFLIVIAVPIGWLPGPGGIPLILIGLGLLAKNNEWARKLLGSFEVKFRYYSDQIVHANPRFQLGLDAIGLSLLGAGLYLAFTASGFLQAAGAALITSSVILLLLNRGRGLWLYGKISRKKP